MENWQFIKVTKNWNDKRKNLEYEALEKSSDFNRIVATGI